MEQELSRRKIIEARTFDRHFDEYVEDARTYRQHLKECNVCRKHFGYRLRKGELAKIKQDIRRV